jgi:hypothetical protein
MTETPTAGGEGEWAPSWRDPEKAVMGEVTHSINTPGGETINFRRNQFGHYFVELPESLMRKMFPKEEGRFIRGTNIGGEGGTEELLSKVSPSVRNDPDVVYAATTLHTVKEELTSRGVPLSNWSVGNLTRKVGERQVPVTALHEVGHGVNKAIYGPAGTPLSTVVKAYQKEGLLGDALKNQVQKLVEAGYSQDQIAEELSARLRAGQSGLPVEKAARVLHNMMGEAERTNPDLAAQFLITTKPIRNEMFRNP